MIFPVYCTSFRASSPRVFPFAFTFTREAKKRGDVCAQATDKIKIENIFDSISFIG